MARTKGDVLIHATVFAQRNLAFGAAVKIVEDGPGHTSLGEGTEVRYADYARRSDRLGISSHSLVATSGIR
jgi:hypothetical protein